MILVMLGVILAVAGLAIYARKRNRDEERRKMEPLHKFAGENNCTISGCDSWDRTLIGIDDREINTLFFIRSLPDREIRQAIRLSEVVSCRLVRAEREIKSDQGSHKITERICISLVFQEPGKEVFLEFYNAGYDRLTLTDELVLAQKWIGIINSLLFTNERWKTAMKESPKQGIPGQTNTVRKKENSGQHIVKGPKPDRKAHAV